MKLSVRVQPRASRNAVTGWQDGVLKVALCAPPVEGEANAALVEFLADAFGLKRRQVQVVSGAASRNKTVSLDGLEDAALMEKLSRWS
jgi:uncharacterized protein (TIGR00251 family)